MFHDPAPPLAAPSSGHRGSDLAGVQAGYRLGDSRPPSAVSGWVGLAGIAGLAAWVVVARRFGMDGPCSALVGLAACALPMIGWSLLVDRVHRRSSTGIDWAMPPRPWRETIDISLAKLGGLWATWGAMAVLYFAGRFYWQGPFAFSMWCLEWVAPAALLLSIPMWCGLIVG